MTRIVALLGVDGAGKTTTLEALRGPALAVLRAPQYHLSLPPGPLASAAEALEGLGAAADQVRQPALKALALFLAMTLYGDAVAAAAEAAPEVLLAERHAVLDMRAYAPFYLPALQALPPRFDWPAPLRGVLPPEAWEALESLVRTLEAREPSFSPGGLAGLPGAIAVLFALPPEALSPALERLCRAPLAALDGAGLLRLEPEQLQARLAAKGGAAELHERIDFLMAFQGALEAHAREALGERLAVIAPGDRPVSAVASEVAAAIGAGSIVQ